MLKKIFIVCPIGAEDSEERRRSDRLLKFVIEPVVSTVQVDGEEIVISRSDKLGEPGRITTQILRDLVESDVVIADLTGTNANVMYEVGIRQALLKPYVLMAEAGQKLPFDLSDFRTVFYQLDLEGASTAQVELKSHLEVALTGSISNVDELLFKRSSNGNQVEDNSSRSILAVLETCTQILHETQETKELVLSVGNIAIGIHNAEQQKIQLEIDARKEAQSQEMAMRMMQQILQNPEGVDKVIPAMEAFANLAKRQAEAEAAAQAQQVEAKPNRATRRKKPE